MAKKRDSFDAKQMRRDLAEIGIRGLRADQMVARARRAWRAADKELVGMERSIRRFLAANHT